MDAKSRKQYCGFSTTSSRACLFRDAVIWSEGELAPVLARRTLAPRRYRGAARGVLEAAHALRGNGVNVISTTAAHYDPAGFVRALGEACADRGRKSPILDTFGHNPYPDDASSLRGSRTTIRGRLRRVISTGSAIDHAFSGTSQPVPGGSRRR